MATDTSFAKIPNRPEAVVPLNNERNTVFCAASSGILLKKPYNISRSCNSCKGEKHCSLFALFYLFHKRQTLPSDPKQDPYFLYL